MGEKTDKVVNNIKEYAPSGKAVIRAGISAIPVLGGSLDHLLFDKSDEIRMKNLETAIVELTECVKQLQEERISQEWFDSENALAMFKSLYEKVEFEPDRRKIRSLCQLFCLFGTNEHIDDPNKLAVLETVSKLTNNQRVLFMTVCRVPVEEKTGTSDAINYTASNKWLSTIMEWANKKEVTSMLDIPTAKIEFKNVDGKLSTVVKKPHIDLNEELDILASFNLLRIDYIPNISDIGYSVTALGNLVYSYLQEFTDMQ